MIYYAKYHRNGNSFIIVETRDISGKNKKSIAESVCRTDTGIGADSLIICDTSSEKISMTAYSNIGIRQALNGNGLACLMHYCREYGFINKKEIFIKTDAASIRVKNTKTQPFTTLIYLPPAEIACDACCIAESLYSEEISISTSYGKIPVHPVNSGNIFCVIWLDVQNKWKLNKKGKKALKENKNRCFDNIASEISGDIIFKLKTGVVFAELKDFNTLSVRIYDKNAHRLSSCLTGSAAAAACALHTGKCSGNDIVSGDSGFHINHDGAIESACVTYKISEGFITI